MTPQDFSDDVCRCGCQDEPKPMVGIWSTLTERQQALALAYDGPEYIGQPAVQPEERGRKP